LKFSVKGFLDKTTRFLREVRAELRKVMWPSRRETFMFTAVVIGSVVVISTLIWVVDSAFSQLLSLVIK
jgi:preprotein translocase subunit SecE